ncbi:MAG: ATPase domain-containing protein [Methanomassiliicoccales archaeon]|jgi:KaiC/GvpD/RAD55 family RecA-like ATPase/exonuclease VII small subunit
MAKRFECPRCGSGVKPSDTQCSRCGESLTDTPVMTRSASAPPAPETVAIPVVEKVSWTTVTEIALPSERPKKESATREKVSSSLDKKDKDLITRERAVVASVEQLEKDTKSLEDAIKRFENEDQEMRERERILKQRETEIEEMASKLETAVTSVESGVSGNIERLKELSDEYATKANEARKRQKAQLDREIDERMECLRTMQALIASASGLKAVKEEPRTPPAKEEVDGVLAEEEVADMISALEEELSPQIGAGLANSRLEVHTTNDERLDRILGGGLPVGYVIIVNGAAGTMKSTLCYSILHSLASRSGRRSMYFSLEQKRDSIVRQMDRMGLGLDATNGSMIVVDMVDLRKRMEDEPGDWREILMRYVKNVHDQMPFDYFVLDSLDSFRGMTQAELDRESMKDLFDWFKDLNITVFVITEKPIGTLLESEHGETYLADGVVELQMKEFDDAKVHRWLRCVKMRGLPNDSRYYAFYHTGTEFKFSVPLVDSGK